MGPNTLRDWDGVEIRDDGRAWSGISVSVREFDQLEGVAAYEGVEYREVLEAMVNAAMQEYRAGRWIFETFTRRDGSYFTMCKPPGLLPGFDEDGYELEESSNADDAV